MLIFTICMARRRTTRKGSRRKTARRAYTRTRRRTRRRATAPKTAGNKVYGLVKQASPWLAFASQITAKDYEALQGTDHKNADMATKAKVFANIVAGRLTGFTPFKGDNLYGSDTTPFTINPSGVANKFTGLGVAGMIYKNLPIKQLPQKSKIGAIGKRLLLGGAIGGLFDAPSGNPHTTSSAQVLGRNMSVQQQNRLATTQTGMYSSSNDVTGGSF